MAGIPRDGDHEISSNRDKSLEFLLIAFIATGSIAGLMIVIGYATGGGHIPDGAEPMRGDAAESEPEELLDAEKQQEEPVYDFTEYIDNLLSNAKNESSK
jgi:hypothetical protein